MEYKVQVFEGKNQDEWFWHIKHVNGNILATSQSYTQKHSAEEVALNLHNNLANSTYEVLEREVAPDQEGQ